MIKNRTEEWNGDEETLGLEGEEWEEVGYTGREEKRINTQIRKKIKGKA